MMRWMTVVVRFRMAGMVRGLRRGKVWRSSRVVAWWLSRVRWSSLWMMARGPRMLATARPSTTGVGRRPEIIRI